MATEINGWSIWNFHSIDKWINITKSIGFWKNGKFYLHWKAPFLLTKYMQKINTAKGLWLGFSALERWFKKLHNMPESDSFAWPWMQSKRIWTNGHLLATPLHHPSVSATQPSQSDHTWNKLAPSFRNIIKNSNKTELKKYWKQPTVQWKRPGILWGLNTVHLAHTGYLSEFKEVSSETRNEWQWSVQYFRGDTETPYEPKGTAVLSTFHSLPLWYPGSEKSLRKYSASAQVSCPTWGKIKSLSR